MFHNYTIENTDRFAGEAYPEVVKEVAALTHHIGHISGRDKADMVISFLKDHCLASKWVLENRSLAQAITADTLEASHIESLFACCRANKLFLGDFEAYIKTQIH